MRSTAEIVVLASAVVAAVVALSVYGRRGWQWLRRAGRDLGVLRDTLVGSDPVMHPVRRDEELVAAKPGLALRMDKIETTLIEIATTNRRLDAVETDLVNNRAQALAEHNEFDHRISALEDSRVERTVARAESAAMWTAIAADRTADGPAADAQPLDNPDD